MKPGQLPGRVKLHVKEHKETYIASSVTALLAIAGTLAVTSGSKAVQLSPLSFAYKSTLVQTAVLTRRGHPGFVVKCNETGELFASIQRAAELMNISRPNLSAHLNGRLPQVSGYTFTKLGEAV
jgi:hypothetical protein